MLALLAPGSAAAYTIRDFQSCTTGAFQACASVQVWTVPRAGGGTDIFMRVANLSGYRLANLLMAFGPSAPAFGYGFAGWSAQGGAPVVGSPGFDWSTQPRQLLITSRQFYQSVYSPTGIEGCVPTDMQRGVRTCGGGYVLFNFTHAGTVGLPDRVAVGFAQGFTLEQCGIVVGASSDPACNVTYTDIESTVIPEPVTVILLGSGLAGLAAFRRRRDRRRDAQLH